MYLETVKSVEYFKETYDWEIQLAQATLIVGHPKYGGDDSVDQLEDSMYTGDNKDLMDYIVSYDNPLPEQDYEQLHKYFRSIYGIIIARNIGYATHYTQLQPLWNAIIDSIPITGSQIIATTQSLEVIYAFANALLKYDDPTLGKVACIGYNKSKSQCTIVDYNVEMLKTNMEYSWDIR